MPIKKLHIFLLFVFCFCEAAFSQSFDKSKCLAALVEHQHYASQEAAEADPFVQRQIIELTRFNEGSTDAPHMTAEFLPEFGTYRIVPRNQTPIQKAKIIFIAIHGNGGGNSGPHSLSAILTRVQKMGVLREGEESQIYVEAPALPGAEAGPNRNNYEHPALVAKWLAKYIKHLIKQNPGAKFVDFTRSSGFDFAFKAHLEEELAKEGIFINGDLIGMSPTTTGTTAADQPRIQAAKQGAIDDLSTNGSGVNQNAFQWIMSMITQSHAWTADQFQKFSSLWLPTGSKDKQVALEEREFISHLIRDSGGNATTTDFFGAHHDVFDSKEGYDPEAQAYPMLEARIRSYLDIEPKDASLTPESFSQADSRQLGNQNRLLTEIHPSPRAQEIAFGAGYRYQASEVHIVSSPEQALAHYNEQDHTNPAIYVIGQNEFAKPFRQVGSIPGFSSFRPSARVPDLANLAQSGRIKIKGPDGSIETLDPKIFKTREIVNPEGIKQIASEGRLVQRIVMSKKDTPDEIYYVGITPGNIDHYRTWIKLEGDAKTKFATAHSPQIFRQDAPNGQKEAPKTNDNLMVNLERAANQGNILILPKDSHYEKLSQDEIKAFGKATNLHRFDPIYFENYDRVLTAAEKGKLFEESKEHKETKAKSIRYISADAIREFVAQTLVKRDKAQPKIWSVLEVALRHETNHGQFNNDVIIVKKNESGVTVVEAISASNITNFIPDPSKVRLVFNEDVHSPASLVFHGWVKPIKKHVFKSSDMNRFTFLKKELDDSSLSMTKDTAFWTLMKAASTELDEAGRPMYDVHSWMLPQVLYHQHLGHSIEIVDETRKLVGGAILLNKGDQWSIDALVDLRTKSEGLSPATSAKDSIVIQNALAEALNFAFKNGAENVDMERVAGQVHSLLEDTIDE